MEIESDQLLLREWKEEDAWDLVDLAKDMGSGPERGRLVQSLSEGRRIFWEGMQNTESYTVVLKESEKVMGCIALRDSKNSRLGIGAGEAELDCWPEQISVTEAGLALLGHAFSDLGVTTVWFACHEGNEHARQLQEALGMKYRFSQFVATPRVQDAFMEDVACVTKEDFFAKRK